MTKARSTAYSALLGNVILWGLAFPIVKLGFNAGLSPTTFLLGRFLVAAVVSLPILALLRPKTNWSKLPTIILLELVGTLGALYLLYQGLSRTSAVEASLIAVTWPIFVTLGGVWFLKEKEERHEAGGLVLAVFGTLLLVLGPLLKNGLGGHTTGNLLILGQNLLIATYYLLAKKLYKGLNKWFVTSVSFWVGLIGFTFIYLLNPTPLTGFDPVSWPLVAILFMGIFGSVIALTLYLIGQDKIEASEAAVFTYLQPLIAVPAALLLLGESITFIEIIAITIVAAGVYLTEKR